MMNACCELIIPVLPEIDGLVSSETTFTWEGEKYLQGDVHYLWGNFVRFKLTQPPKHIEGYVKKYFCGNEPITLSIQEESLRLLELDINGISVDWEGKSLEKILRSILAASPKWMIVYELNCDQIDSSYQFTINECLTLLKDNLKFDNEQREGFIAFGI